MNQIAPRGQNNELWRMMAYMAYETPFSCNEVTKAKTRFSSSQYLIFFVSEKGEMYLINSKSP